MLLFFNDALNTFYLRLCGRTYGKRPFRQREWKPAVATWQQWFFYMHHPRIVHTTAFVTPVVEHWLGREVAQWVHHEGSIRRPIAPSNQSCQE